MPKPNKKKYIRIEVLQVKPKTKEYGIFSLKLDKLLGRIYWYFGWRQYVFAPSRLTIWNDGCLEDVVKFLKELKEERKREKEKCQN